MTSGINSLQLDAPWPPRGTGQAITWRCLHCGQDRPAKGARGVGARRKCAQCVAKSEAKKAGRAAG